MVYFSEIIGDGSTDNSYRPALSDYIKSWRAVDLHGTSPDVVDNSGFTLPYNPAGWFETGDNALLNLELSAAISVDGCITYVEI